MKICIREEPRRIGDGMNVHFWTNYWWTVERDDMRLSAKKPAKSYKRALKEAQRVVEDLDDLLRIANLGAIL